MGSACSVKISPQAQSTVTAKPAWPEPTVCVSMVVRLCVQIYVCPYMPEWVTVCVGVPDTPNVPELACVCVYMCVYDGGAGQP